MKIKLIDYKDEKINKEFEYEEFIKYWNENYLPLEHQVHQIASIEIQNDILIIKVVNDFNLNKNIIKTDNAFIKTKMMFENLKNKYGINDKVLVDLINGKEESANWGLRTKSEVPRK
jgi:hypothetical protein